MPERRPAAVPSIPSNAGTILRAERGTRRQSLQILTFPWADSTVAISWKVLPSVDS